MIKKIIITNLFFTIFYNAVSQVLLNGKIDDISELYSKSTLYTRTKDGIKLATDISVPVFRDSIITNLNIGGTSYPLVIIQKNTQYVVYDTTNFGAKNMSLPTIFTRTPYNKNSDAVGKIIFPFLGFNYALQDMRGCYNSEGVYFPMYSDAWQKAPYMPGVFMPMDLQPTTSQSNVMFHSDGSEAVKFLADSLFRIFDYNLDGILDTMPYTNRNIGMYGASALGNTQYQALSDIPFTDVNNPIKCLMPTVATNEHFNTTLFHNGVYLNSLANGWITKQIYNNLTDTLSATDFSITNNIHSPADYGYTTKALVAKDIIDWNFAQPILGGPSGSHPSSVWRPVMDASKAPVDALGNTSATGTVSRYKNLNKPAYHLTGWWDIFINGQIETFNKTREQNPNVRQKIVIGPWTHQRISTDSVGDVIYPSNIMDVIGLDYNSIEGLSIATTPNLVENLFSSEIVTWYRTNLGGEPFFFIPESKVWQNIGGNQIRIPSKNYFTPYYNFINFLGGKNGLNDLPVEIKIGTNINPINYSIPALSPPLFNLTNPIVPNNLNHYDNIADVRMYITGPTNDPLNTAVGNYWVSSDSLPFVNGTTMENYYLHIDNSLNKTAPTINEGTVSYVNDPNNPVYTIGGNNMTVKIPNGTKDSQGSMNLAHPDYINTTMNRPDVLSFETAPFTDTLRIIGFPKATIRAKAHKLIQNTDKTDFDVFVRILDVYPDGRELFITEGAVNARNREYAKSIYNNAINDNLLPSNIDTNQFYNFQFNLLPIGHVFGKNHKLKVLLSSSNYPKYQSNPHIPMQTNEFFRWTPGSTSTYTYNGTVFSSQPSTIVFEISDTNPSFISLPKNTDVPNTVSVSEKKSKEQSFKIYPNPSSSLFYCLFDKSINSTIKVYDITGKVIIEKKIVNQTVAALDLSEFKNGIYIVEVLDNSSFKQYSKIIKM